MLKNILKIEKILNHKLHLHFNVPYGDDDYSYAYHEANNRANRAEEKLKNLWDIPIQTELGEKFPFAGYVEFDGTIHECEPCEHEKIVRDILYNNPEVRYELGKDVVGDALRNGRTDKDG